MNFKSLFIGFVNIILFGLYVFVVNLILYAVLREDANSPHGQTALTTTFIGLGVVIGTLFTPFKKKIFLRNK